MRMTINEVLNGYNIISKILLQCGEKELTKELKVKIMRSRINYGKVRKEFDKDLQECTQSMLTPEFIELRDKERNAEETTKFNELVSEINKTAQLFAIEKSKENVIVEPLTLTNDEFNELIDVNSANDVEIKGIKFLASEFLEIIYEQFVK